LKEQGFQQTGACNPNNCIVQIGQLTGVEQMVGGSFNKIGNLYTIYLKLIDVTEGKIMVSITHDFEGKIENLLKYE